MNDEVCFAVASMVLEGLVGATDETGTPLLNPKTAASLAFDYADALLEAARSRAPQAGGRPPLADDPPRSDAEGDRERPSTAPEVPPPAAVPPAAAPSPSRGEVLPAAPTPRPLPPQCEAPECPLQGAPRKLPGPGKYAHLLRDATFCDLHFTGINPSILVEWHRAHGKEPTRAV